MKKMFVLLVVLMLLLVGCDNTKQPRTGNYIERGESVVFDYVCDYQHNVGMWLFVRVTSVNSDSGTAAGFSVRMTQEEYLDICQPG